MNLVKRIIPCLDFYNGRIVKGVHFNDLIDIGNPVDVANYYNDEGADELIFLDISATIENRSQIFYFIRKISSKISIPLTVGGGIKNLNEVRNLLNSGADKISLNSSLINNPDLILKIKSKYGSQCLVCTVDVKRIFLNNCFSHWGVFKNSGKFYTSLNLFDLVLDFISLGVGEFLLTSIDRDGSRAGYDVELISKLSSLVSISLIASGGVGSTYDLVNILKIKNVNSALIASILHTKNYSIFDLKKFLFNNGILVRL